MDHEETTDIDDVRNAARADGRMSDCRMLALCLELAISA
jgi:hypothetical protein